MSEVHVFQGHSRPSSLQHYPPSISLVSTLFNIAWVWEVLPVFCWNFNWQFQLLIIWILVNFTLYFPINVPLTHSLTLFIPRGVSLRLSCVLFVPGPLIIRVPSVSVGGKLLSRTRAIYLCLFSSRAHVCVHFTVRSPIFPRMPRILQAIDEHLMNKYVR